MTPADVSLGGRHRLRDRKLKSDNVTNQEGAHNMNKLVLSLAVAVTATNAAGCGGGGGGDGEIVADLGWVFKDLATNAVTGCPAGFDTVKVIAIPVDAAGNRVGDSFTDLLDCADGASGDLVSYDPGLYQIFLEIRQGANGNLYAQSLSEFFDLTAGDDTFDYTIFNDAGYFAFAWDLRAASNNAPVSCNGAGASNVELAVTVTGTNDLRSVKFPCGDGGAVTDALLEDSYVASVAALNSANAAVGVSAAQNTDIKDRNQVTELGTIVVPIDGI
ncbi:MAG: hypothetical protein KF773_04605 [Deltaproteobacteria bacterium]|nr:hypothetical protein [Deltaproteobacteria bacterium]MCW5801029.1 hypothetical protein [Deltaproteobacteria bacterium]